MQKELCLHIVELVYPSQGDWKHGSDEDNCQKRRKQLYNNDGCKHRCVIFKYAFIFSAIRLPCMTDVTTYKHTKCAVAMQQDDYYWQAHLLCIGEIMAGLDIQRMWGVIACIPHYSNRLRWFYN